MDSSESPVYGEQEGAGYNGHFDCVCYHPLFVFNQYGDCEGAMLRPGNVHSAHNWREVLEPIVIRYKRAGVRLYFRGDAAFASPEVYEYLEEYGSLYAIRLPSNEVLERDIQHLLKRPVGRKAGGVFAPFRLRTWLEGWRLPWKGFGLGSEGVRLLRERAASLRKINGPMA